MLTGIRPQLYAESLADVSDVAEEISKAQGNYYDVSKLVATVGNKWIGVPWAIGGALIAYRKSWFDEIGYNAFPETWDALLDAGKKLKAKGRPIGQTAGHTFGDSPGWWYPYLWSWGGKEVEADGKTVVLNSRETIESVKFAVGFWKDTCDEGGLAWDDTNNNRAFLSGTISATNNGASIYIEAKRKPEAYLTEKGAPMWKDILHARIPKGPGGQFNLPGPFTDMLMSYSKNQKAAKDFLRWMHSKPVFAEWFTSQQGYSKALPGIGRKIRYGKSIRFCCRSAISRRSAGCQDMRGCPIARPRKCSPNTSSRTCMRRQSKACRPKTR
jgi:multiple sugar transport system substrate-binding protein